MFQAHAINEVIVVVGLRDVGSTLSLVPLLLGHDNKNYCCEIPFLEIGMCFWASETFIL